MPASRAITTIRGTGAPTEMTRVSPKPTVPTQHHRPNGARGHPCRQQRPAERADRERGENDPHDRRAQATVLRDIEDEPRREAGRDDLDRRPQRDHRSQRGMPRHVGHALPDVGKDVRLLPACLGAEGPVDKQHRASRHEE